MMPSLAVIVPVYGQPGYVGEAVQSALASDGVDCRVVLVDDGCPMPETAPVCAALARAWPGRVFALGQANRGVSAARNTGIDFALAEWPWLEAIYFLDADNRLPPQTLGRMCGTLAAHPEAGWAYPDLDVFGIRGYVSMAGPYSELELLFRNYCDAGSLVRRSVFEAGVRFDENPLAGYEDWEFWLQAQARGFRGQYAPHCTLSYRRRGESRVREDLRRHAEIEAYIRRKHQVFYRPRHLLGLEQREAPRYAIVFPESGDAVWTTDPLLRDNHLGATAFERGLVEDPDAAPHFVCFTSQAFLDALDAARLTRGLFWHCESALCAGRAAVTVRAAGGAGWYGLVEAEERAPAEAGAVHLAMMWSHEGRAPSPAAGPLAGLAAGGRGRPPRSRGTAPPSSGSPSGVHTHFALTLPGEVPAAGIRPEHLTIPPPGKPFRDDRGFGRLKRSEIAGHMLEACGAEALYPLAAAGLRECRSGPRHIGFLLSSAEFGGVERVMANYARELGRAGYQCHLFVLGRTRATLLDEFRPVFSGITIVPQFTSPTPDTHPERYMGTPLTAWMMGGDRRRLVGLLSAMDVVVNAHCYEAYAVAGELRRLGITTLASLHVVDRDALGMPHGLPHLAVPYESSHDRFLVISEGLRQCCEAWGIPRSKQLLIRNAPSYEMAPERVREVLEARRLRQRQGGEPLRALFLGRFDWQKGIDHLGRLVAGAQRRSLEIEWRIVGRHLMDSASAGAPELEFLRAWLHPEATRADQLTEHYGWADVLVLPSRFEGVPLTILEAARLGCPALALRVGEVEEALEDGATGLVSDSVEAMLDQLERLAHDRNELARLAGAAADTAQRNTWAANLRPLFDYLETLP